MSFLLDTNVVAEWVKPRPDPGVITWLAGVDESHVFLSVLTLAELRHGVERLAEGLRRRCLGSWLQHDLPLRFEGRLLSVDPVVADCWGTLMAQREAVGQPMGVIDGLIAATARVHRLKLVTRNEADFVAAVVEIINPWSRQGA